MSHHTGRDDMQNVTSHWEGCHLNVKSHWEGCHAECCITPGGVMQNASSRWEMLSSECHITLGVRSIYEDFFLIITPASKVMNESLA